MDGIKKVSPTKKQKKIKLTRFGTPDTTVSAKRYVQMLKGEDPCTKSKWVTDYRSNTTQWRIEREEARRVAQEEAKEKVRQDKEMIKMMNARLAKVHLLTQKAKLEPITMDAVAPRQSWQDQFREHNTICELSGLWAPSGHRAECKFCPVVVRKDVLEEHEAVMATGSCATVAMQAWVHAEEVLLDVAELVGKLELAAVRKEAEKAKEAELAKMKKSGHDDSNKGALEEQQEEEEISFLPAVRSRRRWPKKGAHLQDFNCKLTYEEEMAGMPYNRTAHLSESEGGWVCPRSMLDMHTNFRMKARNRLRTADNEKAERAAIKLQAAHRMRMAFAGLQVIDLQHENTCFF
jgi:hypothetical protein